MIQIFGLAKFPLVNEGDNIGDHIAKAAREEGLQIEDHDVVVVAQKIVSKAEGRVVNLHSIRPSPFAEVISRTTGKDPRHVEMILRETASIVRMSGAHLIVETRHGFVCANAGVDRSNIENEDSIVLLPNDPDKSALEIRKRIRELTGADVGVIISDTFGRAWRIGQIDTAIGVDGLTPVIDYRGTKDMFSYVLRVTQIAVADELASAAELVMKKSSGVPVAIVRGYEGPRERGTGKDLIRPKEEDLFR
jgi:coenzyme F420-0:L-glutamate ligase/coenzyme F420-1:gamma-L-glutamate ligase